MARKKSKSIKGLEGDPYSMPAGSVFVLSPEQLNDPVRRASASKEAELAGKYICTPFKEIQRWPDLFVLSSASDGSYFAMLDGKLEERFKALTAGVDDKPGLLINALSSLDRITTGSISSLLKTARSSSSPKALAAGNRIHIMYGPETTPSDFEHLIILVSNLKDAIGAELHQMHYFRGGPNKDAAKRLIKIFETAVEAWNRRSLDPPAHGNANKFAYGSDYKKVSLQRPLEWIAIQVAKEFVEENQSLPEKGELRARLISLFPKLKSKSHSAWTKVYEKAGLSALGRAETWKIYNQGKQAKAAVRKAQKGGSKCPTAKNTHFSVKGNQST